jgi:hypothetical protein
MRVYGVAGIRYALLHQETTGLGGTQWSKCSWMSPREYLYNILGVGYFVMGHKKRVQDSACLDWQSVAVKHSKEFQ